MFYVIGSEKSKSGSASYNSCQQNQRRGGAVRYFRCTDTVSDKSDFHKICLNISIFSLYVDKLSTTLLYKHWPLMSRFVQEMLASTVVSFLWTGAAALLAIAPWLPYSGAGRTCQRRAKPVHLDRWYGRSALLFQKHKTVVIFILARMKITAVFIRTCSKNVLARSVAIFLL